VDSASHVGEPERSRPALGLPCSAPAKPGYALAKPCQSLSRPKDGMQRDKHWTPLLGGADLAEAGQRQWGSQ